MIYRRAVLSLLLILVLVFVPTPDTFADDQADDSVHQLLASISSDRQEVADAGTRVYQQTAMYILPNHAVEGLINSAYTNEEFASATLSAPIPVFASTNRYAKTDEFKSRLVLVSWDFIVYVDGSPVAVFTIGTADTGYEYCNLIGQDYAEKYQKACSQLGDGSVLMVPVGVCSFIVGESGYVAVVNPVFDHEEHPFVSFNDLNNAATRAIYNTIGTPAEHENGGGFNLDYLYRPESIVDNNFSTDNDEFSQGVLFATIAACILLTAGIWLYFMTTKYKIVIK
jgi:hypothetical protein